MRPPGGSSVPRFRPVNTRKRAIGVSVVVAVLASIGAGAWAFGINAESDPTAGCVEQAYAAPPPTGALVNVYNSTQRTGLANEVAEELRERGFQIGETGNDPERRKIRGTGELRVQGTNSEPLAAAESQKEALQAWNAGMSVSREKRGSDGVVDYVLGERWAGLSPEPVAPPWVDLPCVPIGSEGAVQSG
ncbi:MAG: LytR C-terminal domain-containing protein [Sporichthyaceae bacterium]